ncbi:hypothetical protein [Sphingomonas oryzagri]|uniref:Uncharacterized protein n=1 Tax=Sphingomonas oryzagri TaxID=3042314 RepID=A0ABT6N110_9SPHN|nr:hypothetical protein [Sphingomonas oryzagri]MDH7638945.1 hypothetical protein [Sphingomonas oryzagri]
MTQRRQQVLSVYADMIASGQEVRLAELARRCGLWGYSDARRVLDDLKRMGAVG